VLDPKVFLLLATGALLLLNGLIARSAAAKRPTANELADAPTDDPAAPEGDAR
jgi:hypothetical protein